MLATTPYRSIFRVLMKQTITSKPSCTRILKALSKVRYKVQTPAPICITHTKWHAAHLLPLVTTLAIDPMGKGDVTITQTEMNHVADIGTRIATTVVVRGSVEEETKSLLRQVDETMTNENMGRHGMEREGIAIEMNIETERRGIGGETKRVKVGTGIGKGKGTEQETATNPDHPLRAGRLHHRSVRALSRVDLQDTHAHRQKRLNLKRTKQNRTLVIRDCWLRRRRR